MTTYQLRPMALGEILDATFVIFRRHFGTLFGIAVACNGIPIVLQLFGGAAGGMAFRPGLWVLGWILGLLGGLLAAGATLRVISEAYLGREPRAGQALTFAAGKMWRLFVAGLAKGIVIMLATLLLVIPGIIVACGYAVVSQAVVLEPLPSATDALGRSWNLTKGYKGKVFLLAIVVFLLAYIPSMAAGALAAIVPTLAVPLAAAGGLLSLMVYPIVACAFTLLYYDLRVRKEAFDIDLLSQQIGAGTVAV